MISPIVEVLGGGVRKESQGRHRQESNTNSGKSENKDATFGLLLRNSESTKANQANSGAMLPLIESSSLAIMAIKYNRRGEAVGKNQGNRIDRKA